MSPSSSNLRGIALMTAATAAFIINDSFLKLVMGTIPPFETLFLRGVLTVIVGLPLLGLTGGLRFLPRAFEGAVLLRNGFELLAVLGYILALAYAPIADVTALSQLAPMILTLAAVWFFGAKIGRWELALICLAFFGALMVAQPGASGFSAFALFGLWNAFASAARDLTGRRVKGDVPGLVVAWGAGFVVMIGAAIAMLLVERFVVPDLPQMLMLTASALFLTAGHFCIFMSFRVGAVGAVAPFYYTGTIWALIAGIVVFNAIPNELARVGIALILVSGIVVVWMDARRNRVTA